MSELRAYYNDSNPFVCEWLRKLVGAGLVMDGDVDERSIKDVQPGDLGGYIRCHFFAGIGGWDYALQLAGWPIDRPVWTGSCPCQPFSQAGSGKGFGDVRHLWPEFMRLITALRPADVFGEQAPSVEWMDHAAMDLESQGYAVGTEVRRADCHGASHQRRRFYWHAADTAGERQPQPWNRRQDAIGGTSPAFREADRLVDAFRRSALPFLCGGHDGLPVKLAEGAIAGLGNAIVPAVAADFIAANSRKDSPCLT